MSQHFLLSRSAKTLTLAHVFRMSDAEAETAFAQVRWPDNNGKPVCPHCGGVNAYDCRRPNGAPRFRCRACKGFLAHVRNAVRLATRCRSGLSRGHRDLLQRGQGQVGAGALPRSGRLLQVRFRVCHKLREAMAAELKGRVDRRRRQGRRGRRRLFRRLRQARQPRENRVDRRLRENQNGKRKVVVIVRERDGNSVPAVFRAEKQAQKWIKSRIAKGTIVNADEASSWDGLHGHFEMKRINHEEAYSLDGACTNMGRGIFQPHAPRRSGPSSPCRRRLPASLRSGKLMARRSSPHEQRRSDFPRCRARDAQGYVARLRGILATPLSFVMLRPAERSPSTQLSLEQRGAAWGCP